MKLKKHISAILITAAIVLIAIVRLISNKNSFDEELKLVSENNTIIPVTVDTVKYIQTNTEFSANGTFSPYQEVSIAAETHGKIISINSKAGDNVTKGQVLAVIDNEVFASQLEFAKFNLEKAEKDMKRYQQLSQSDAATMQQYETAKQDFESAKSAYTSAKTEYENSFIKAPFNGILTKQHVDNGTYISEGSPVFDIVEINRLKFIVRLTVDETDKIREGQNVKVTADAYPGITYDGKVKAIIVKADFSKRYEVEIETNNRRDKIIKPGMFGNVVFSDRSDKQALVIPRKAITGSINNSEVYVAKGDAADLQKIIAAPLNDKYVLVNGGLKAGDIVVTSGQINLTPGRKIKFIK